jgi:arsenate reductase
MKKIKVLFVGSGNSARSQMVEALLKRYAGERFEAYSAGLEPGGIHPYARQVLKEIGIDLTSQYSKDLDEYMGRIHFDYLITVCDSAEKKCPTTLPGGSLRLHWPFENPTTLGGTEEEKLEKFREVRDQIDQRIRSWLAEQGATVTE